MRKTGGGPRRCYRVSEVAEMLAVGRTLVYEEIRRGELRVVMIGCRMLVEAAELDAYLERKRGEPAALLASIDAKRPAR